MNKFKEAITQSVKLLSGRAIRISVKQNGDMMMVEQGEHVAFVPVADEWPHAEVDKIAEEIYPERRDMLAQQLGWGGKDEVYGLAMKFGVPQIVAITLHDTESVLMVELADKTTFPMMPSDSLCGLWRATEALTVAQLANEVAKAYKASGAATVESKWESELARLKTQWLGATERAGVELEEGAGSVMIDEATRKVLVLIDDEVVGEVVAPEDDEFGAWLGNSRKFGKSMANIAKKLAPVAAVQIEEEVMEDKSKAVIEFITKEWNSNITEELNTSPMKERNLPTPEVAVSVSEVNIDGKVGFKYEGVFGDRVMFEFDTPLFKGMDKLVNWALSGVSVKRVLVKAAKDTAMAQMVSVGRMKLVEKDVEVVDVLAEAKRCMAVVMEDAGVEYPIEIVYYEENATLVYKIDYKVYNVSRTVPDKLNNIKHLTKAAETCLREIKFQENEKKRAEEALVEPVAEVVVEVAPVAPEVVAEPAESVPEPVKATPDTLSREMGAKLIAKLYTATSIIKHDGWNDDGEGYGGMIVKWDDSTRELMAYINRNWVVVSEVPEGQTVNEWVADGRRNWRPIRKFAEQVRALEIEEVFEGMNEYSVIGEVEAIEEVLADAESIIMAEDFLEPSFDVEYATALAPNHPLFERYNDGFAKMKELIASPDFAERKEEAHKAIAKRAEKARIEERTRYLTDEAYRAEADAWVNKFAGNALFRGTDGCMDLRQMLKDGMSLDNAMAFITQG